MTLFTDLGAERYDFTVDGEKLTYKWVGNEHYPPLPVIETVLDEHGTSIHNLTVPMTADGRVETLTVVEDLVETIGETVEGLEGSQVYDSVILPVLSADLYNLRSLIAIADVVGEEEFVDTFKRAVAHPELAGREEIRQRDLGVVLQEMYGELPPDAKEAVMERWENDRDMVETGLEELSNRTP